jgi:EmrB/QacA subfamily drug resistance transporter
MPPVVRWTLVAAVLGSGMVFLDSTVVTVALPQMGADLPTDRLGVLEAQAYVYNGYLLTLSALLIVGGALTDQLGRRRIFVVGLVAFAVTSVLCGVAPTMETLIAGRLLQGAAGALLVPGSLSLITASCEGEVRGRALGIWAAASGITTILGPLVGGLLVDTVSWRAVFFLNVPLAVIGLWATVRHVEESRDEETPGTVDWRGAGVAVAALGGLTFGVIRGQEQAWQDAVAFVALGIGVVASAVFVPLMARSRNPLVPLELFASRNFTVTNVSTLLIYGGLYVGSYFTVVFMQGTLGYNAAAAGVATIPAVLFLSVFSPRFGALAGRHGPRWYMAVGPAIMGIGTLWLTRIPATSEAWLFRLDAPASLLPPTSYVTDVLPAMLLLGIGLVVVVAPLTTALMNSVPVRNAGVASAVNNAISRVGPQLATALLFIAVTAGFYSSVVEQVPDVDPVEVRASVDPLNAPPDDVSPELAVAVREASTEGFRLAMLGAALLMFAGAAVNGAGIRNHDPATSASSSA